MPFLHGEAKTASAGSVYRIPAADIEDAIVKSLKEHLVAKQAKSAASAARLEDRGAVAQLVAGIVVYEDRLVVRLKSDNADEASDTPDDRSLTIPWQKPPSKRSRQILLPHNASRSDVRPEQFKRRAHLVSAIARGRRCLDDVVSGRVTSVAQLCAREKCSVRQVNMTISLALLAPNLVKAAVEGRLPRGIGIERLRDPPTEWSRQFEALGLNPEIRSDFALTAGSRERNFWMQRQGAKNRHQNARAPTETKIRELSGRKSPQKRPIWRPTGNVRFAETGWWR
jgi:site-specific DNA recombinase